ASLRSFDSMQTTTVPSPAELLAKSSATSDFVAAFTRFVADNKASDHIAFGRGCPPVKVLRVLCQLLESHPELAIESTHVEGQSGCSDFRGTLKVTAGGSTHTFDFVWDCAWRAEQ